MYAGAVPHPGRTSGESAQLNRKAVSYSLPPPSPPPQRNTHSRVCALTYTAGTPGPSSGSPPRPARAAAGGDRRRPPPPHAARSGQGPFPAASHVCRSERGARTAQRQELSTRAKDFFFRLSKKIKKIARSFFFFFLVVCVCVCKLSPKWRKLGDDYILNISRTQSHKVQERRKIQTLSAAR